MSCSPKRSATLCRNRRLPCSSKSRHEIAKASAGGLDVQVTFRNTGHVDSDEVPQVYLGAPGDAPAGVQFPVRSLVAFDRERTRQFISRQIRRAPGAWDEGRSCSFFCRVSDQERHFLSLS